MLAAPPARRSAWSLREKIVRFVWSLAAPPLWALLPPARGALLRAFGGRVGNGCRFGRGVAIAVPWNLDFGAGVQIEDGVILYALGPISIGAGCVIDYGAHLCAGTHDMRDTRFPLLRPPIAIGPGTFIGIGAFIGPGVTLGRDCRVWPRACVYRSFGDGAVLRGNPAAETSEGGP
jgi:putative colanic acid biosynthesis acetyltransferase WcaF